MSVKVRAIIPGASLLPRRLQYILLDIVEDLPRGADEGTQEVLNAHHSILEEPWPLSSLGIQSISVYLFTTTPWKESAQ